MELRVTCYRLREEFHARPIADFVRLAQRYEATLRLWTLRQKRRHGGVRDWRARASDPKSYFAMSRHRRIRNVRPREYLVLVGKRAPDAREAVDALAGFLDGGHPLSRWQREFLRRYWTEQQVRPFT